MILKLLPIVLFLGLALAFPQEASKQNDSPSHSSDGSELTQEQKDILDLLLNSGGLEEVGISPVAKDEAVTSPLGPCGHASYGCVPFYQCVNGLINTDGEGLLDVRVRPTANCIDPDNPDLTAICCLIPGQPATPAPLDVCPDAKECVDYSHCSGEGYIVTDGTGLISIRDGSSTCYKSDGVLGVCCERLPQPPPVAREHCSKDQECVPWERCIKGSISTGDLIGDHQKPDNYDSLKCGQEGHMCCASSLPHLPDHSGGGSSVSLKDQCDNPSYDCVPYFQCDNGVISTGGEGLIDVRISPKACVNPEYKDVPAVCCRIPGETATPAPIDHCPNNGECLDASLCPAEKSDIGNIQLHCYTAEKEVGVCCPVVNPPPPPPPVERVPELKPAQHCGIRNYHIDQRIQSNYADNEAAFGEFPWQSIIFFQNYTFKCGASLISDRHVITAAHCVHNVLPSEIRLRFGEWQVNSYEEKLPYEDYNVRMLTIHPNFNPKNVHNDVAVLELVEPIKLKYHINTVCLPPVDYLFKNGEKCFTTGWGKDSFYGSYQVILKKIDLPFVDQGTCETLLRKTRLGKYFKLNKSFVCAGGEENKDACFGDGGGPLVCKDPATGHYLLAGITAWGIECGLKDVPGVYANVQMFRPWVDEIIHGFNKKQETAGELPVSNYGK